MARSAHGIYYEVHGKGFPLILGYPITASAMSQDPKQEMLRGYLDALTDRYCTLVMDYPDLGEHAGRSDPPQGWHLTAQRVCEDMLAVADSAGFERFMWWGYSWGGVIGLQLASRTDRVAALVCGGWPPLGGPYAQLLRAVRIAAETRPASFYLPPEQFVSYYESLQEWPEATAIARIRCPRMAFVGSCDDVEIAGLRVPLAEIFRNRRREIEEQGWEAVEIPGRDHTVFRDASAVTPLARSFFDRAI